MFFDVAAFRRSFRRVDASFCVFHRRRHSGEQSDSSRARGVELFDSVAVHVEGEGGQSVRFAADDSTESEAQGCGCGRVWESFREGAVPCVCGGCVGYS